MSFDPDAYLKATPAPAPFDPDTYLKKTEPESNVMADAARRFASEVGATGGQVVSGIGSAQAAGTDLIDQAQIAFGRLVGAPEAALDRLKQRQAEQRAKADQELTGKIQRGGKFVSDAAREAYDIDPTRNDTLVAKIAQGAGSLPVAIASGPAAPLTVANRSPRGRSPRRWLRAAPRAALRRRDAVERHGAARSRGRRPERGGPAPVPHPPGLHAR